VRSSAHLCLPGTTTIAPSLSTARQTASTNSCPSRPLHLQEPQNITLLVMPQDLRRISSPNHRRTTRTKKHPFHRGLSRQSCRSSSLPRRAQHTHQIPKARPLRCFFVTGGRDQGVMTIRSLHGWNTEHPGGDEDESPGQEAFGRADEYVDRSLHSSSLIP